MAGLCEGGNEPSGSLKAICKINKVAYCAIFVKLISVNYLKGEYAVFQVRESYLKIIKALFIAPIRE
ncbi:hypothetical protein ANN_18267 [Periplaneta americana]|uniref:Uncharacterized protein n=1 Tax=Periplaneta americana TaxID=6978 RepID=A0ABQ8SPJ4_PERAM|nr:hypothetical protein ANN_18267 [Periplaneta americana]